MTETSPTARHPGRPGDRPLRGRPAAAAVIAERTGVDRATTSPSCSAPGWGQTGDLIGETLGRPSTTPTCPASPRPPSPGHSGIMRSVAIGDTGRRALVFGTRTHFYEGRGVARRRARRPHRRRRGLPHDRAHQRLRRPQPGVGARHPGADPRPHQPHGATPRSRARNFVDLTDLYSPRLRDARAARSTPTLDEGVYVQFRGPALRDPGRGADGRRDRRRPGRHVAPRSRRSPPARPGWRCSASRWSPTSPPASATSRSPRRGARGRPGRRRALRPPARRRRRTALSPAMGDAADAPLADLARAPPGPGPTTTRTRTRAELRRASPRAAGGRRGRRGATSPTGSPGCSSSAPPGCAARLGAGPNRMNRAVVIRAAAGLTAYLQERDGPSRSSSSATTRAQLRRLRARHRPPSWSAPGGRRCVLPHPLPDPGARLRDPPPRRRRRRHGHRQPQPAAGQRLQGLPRRRHADRAAGGRRRSPPRSPRRAGRRRRPRRRRLGHARRRRWSTPTSTTAARWSLRDSPRELTVVHTALHGVGPRSCASAFARGRFRRRRSSVAAPGRARPRVPDGLLPQPRGAGRDGRRARRSPREVGADLVLANDPDADRCAVAVPTRRPTAAGGCCAATRSGALLGAHILAPRRVPTRTRVFANSIVSSRLLAAMCRAAGRAARGDADRVQVDRAGAGAPLRLRGGARLLRRPAPGARQGRRLARRCSSRSWPPTLKAAGAHARSTGSTTWPASTGVYATDAFSVRVDDLSLIGRIMARLRSSAAHLGGGRRRGPGRRPRTGRRRAAADRGAALLPRRRLAGSSCGRRAPSPSSRSTSRSSSRSPASRPAGGTGRGRGPAGPHPRRDDASSPPPDPAVGRASGSAGPASDQGEEDDRQERQDEREHGLRDPAGRDGRGRRRLDLARGDRGGVLGARVLDRVRDRAGGDLGGLGGGVPAAARASRAAYWSSLVLMPGRRLEATLGRSTCEEIAQAVQPSSPAHTLTFQRASTSDTSDQGMSPPARCCSAGRRPG